MEQRTLEINLISAKDLHDVNLLTKMDVYAVVSLSGDPHQPPQKSRSPSDRHGGKNPIWNFPAKFTVSESQLHRLNLAFHLRCDRALGDKDVGEVTVPVKELLNSAGDGKSMQFVSYQVRKPSGKPKGELNFSFRFGDKFESAARVNHAEAPVTAYPAPPPPVAGTSAAYGAVPGSYPPPPHAVAPGYGYPPPPPQGGYPPPGYGYPPPPGYGYPPGQPGYGYPPVQAPAQKKNRFGMGLGAGLLGGAIGGLLIGDMVSDAAYDGGFDGGFDF